MAAMLQDWNFADEALNGTSGLINRQKSAGNLTLLALNDQAKSAVFLDPEKKTQSNATLCACDCHDFHFVGRSPRKTFQPCKHIYRLAMELGLLVPRYLDHAAREALRSASVGEQKRCEDDRLRGLGRDLAAWGRWPTSLHASGLQQNRQYRAYLILEEEPQAVPEDGGTWHIREYVVTLEDCTCPDFAERCLPCKHVYVVALQLQLPVAISRAEYCAARQQGRELIFEFQTTRLDPLSRI